MLRRLEQDARPVMTAEPASAHMVLGGVASLRWETDHVHHHYRIALQHLDAAETYYNYSVALANVEERESAFEAAATAHARTPDDKFLLDNAIGLAMDGGHFAEGLVWCGRWRALAPDETHALAHSLDRLACAASAQMFSETAVRRVLAILGHVQREARVRSVSSIAKEDPRDPGSFLYEQHVDATPEQAARLNAGFVDEVVAHSDLIDDPGFHFIPMFVGIRVQCP